MEIANRVNSKLQIILIGASFETGNLGVSALAWSSINLLMNRWPNAEFMILSGRNIKISEIRFGDKMINIINYPVRYCKNIFTNNHIWKLILGTKFKKNILVKKMILKPGEETLRALLNCDIIFDITGGDSFSDIYGLTRFLQFYLLKKVCVNTGTQYIMLPQTYGPYKHFITRLLAKEILQRAAILYSRDEESIDLIKTMIGDSSKIRLYPDVAFSLTPSKVQDFRTDNTTDNTYMTSFISRIDCWKKEHDIIGINISGLLFNKGYSGNNEFGLATDYKEVINNIISFFCANDNCRIILIPHVYEKSNKKANPYLKKENDLAASYYFHNSLPSNQSKKMLVLEEELDQNQIKLIIGKCDFFIGSRMHSTIAAISQFIPTAGLAYSKKFSGVYRYAGIGQCVVDLRKLKLHDAINQIIHIFENKEAISMILQDRVPKMNAKLSGICDDIQLELRNGHDLI